MKEEVKLRVHGLCTMSSKYLYPIRYPSNPSSAQRHPRVFDGEQVF